ncbi:MAG: orotidine 5'-phosphate decarboxylase / HUMPS family protein [Planctomycetota bacterium]
MALLQLALDFLELPRALKAAREAVPGGVDWLEAGTPLIKSEGLDAVRSLRKEFPRIFLVADLKTMDTGRLEVEAAAKAGANLVMVMGVAPLSTLRECAEAGANYGVKIGVDFLGVADAPALAKRLLDIGIDHVSVHTGVDEQMEGKTPFDAIRAIRPMPLVIGAAGGLHSGNAGEAVRAGADVIVVGGAITKSEDALEATRRIKTVLSTGESRPTDLFKRVSGGDVRNAFETVSTANVSDALHRSGEIRGIPPLRAGLKLVGRAVTVRTLPGDWAKPVEAIDVAQPGEVVVIAAGGVEPAVWGELATESAKGKGLAGVVIDGAIRDSGEIRRLNFPAFARIVTPTAGEPKGFGEINVPVKIAGVAVHPGDWVIGDDDGIVIVPLGRATEIANRAMDVLERENRLRKEIREGTTLSKVADLLRWEKIS